MQIIGVVLALAVATAAIPAGDSLHARDTLARCEDAPNCEIYTADDGLRIRFKAGMEPGSSDYAARFPNDTGTGEHAALVGRNTQTHVTFGDTSINYGTTNPCDALHHCLFDYCHEGACDSNTCTTATSDLYHQGASSGPRSRTLLINSHGQYNGWSERDNYVNAVVAAASKGQKWTQHDWCIRTKEGDDCGTQWWGQQTNFISLNKFYNGNLRGYIEATVAMDGGAGGWCGAISAVLGAIGGAVGSIGGGFFGAIDPLCG